MKIVIGLAAVCALALPAGVVHAQLTGALFTEPEEREYLDYLREEFLRNSAEAGFNIEETAIPDIPDGQAAPSGPVEFTFGGIVTRRDGSHSIWLNQRLLEESELPDGMSLVTGEGSPSLRILYSGSTFVLRPGQTVDLTTGTVTATASRPAPTATSPAQSTANATAPAAAADGTPIDVVQAQAQAATQPGADAAAAETTAEATQVTTTAVPASVQAEAPTEDALANAVNELDGEAVGTLLEILENRRVQLSEAGAADEEPENEAP